VEGLGLLLPPQLPCTPPPWEPRPFSIVGGGRPRDNETGPGFCHLYIYEALSHVINPCRNSQALSQPPLTDQGLRRKEVWPGHPCLSLSSQNCCACFLGLKRPQSGGCTLSQ
jgi:hypothetical protein